MELEGIKFGGRNVNNIRYADDTVLLADSAEKLESLVGELVRASDRHGFKLNTAKTKVMVVTKGAFTRCNFCCCNRATQPKLADFGCNATDLVAKAENK